MKSSLLKTMLETAAAIGAIGIVVASGAATASSGPSPFTATMKVHIICPIEVNEVTPLNFGNIVKSTVAGYNSYSMSYAGAVTPQGGTGNGSSSGVGAAAGSFTFTGDASAPLVVTVTNPACPTGLVLYNLSTNAVGPFSGVGTASGKTAGWLDVYDTVTGTNPTCTYTVTAHY
jgi:hypothetical protein